MKTHHTVACLLILFSSMATSCQNSKISESEEDKDAVYEAFVLERKEVSTELVLPGELVGYYETGIIAKVNGYVKRIFVDIGDKVTQGQLLTELEAPELKSQLTGAFSDVKEKEAMYLNTKGKYARLLQTNKTPGAVSPYDMDFSRTGIISDSLRFLAAKAGYEAIKQLTDYLSITAPFDGVVTERALAPGAFVGPNDKNGIPILKLKNESRLRLHVAVPEKHLGELEVGKRVQFKVKSFPARVFEGIITRLAKNVDTQTRSEIAEIEIDNRSNYLLPGMYAQVTIPLRRPEASFVVLQSAIVTNMERSFVIKVVKNKVIWVDIQKGEDQGQKVEIFGDLIAGDTLLVTASDETKAGTTIKTIMVSQ